MKSVKGADLKPLDRQHRWLTDMQAAVPKPPFGATWEYKDTGFEIIMLNPVDNFVSTFAPGWRSHRGDQLNAPPIRQIIAENQDDEKESSFFVSLLVPQPGGKSPVISTQLLAYDKEKSVAAIKVELENRTDYIISTKDDIPRTFGPVTVAGRFGFVSLNKSGNLIGGYLIGGKTLKCGSKSINLPSDFAEIQVASAEGQEYTLAANPPSQLKPGMHILAGELGFEVESIKGKVLKLKDYLAQETKSIRIPMQGQF
jgi:hypothetical protein